MSLQATPTPTMAPDRDLTASELDALSIIERVCSVLSLLGCLVVIVTFCSSKAFHKPINRLVFYASFGNMMTNVGTLMARTYIQWPWSVGCQLQAFLIQMFMPADAFWILAMAINVYLTFYFKFDAERLRKMEVPYLICCYGIPFIPAFTYIFIKDGQGQRVYGNATLWCWVTTEWDIWRIATFYGPVWVTILLTFFIYIRAGNEIYQKRKQLYNFSSANRDADPLSQIENAVSMKTTEVYVTSEAADPGRAGPMGAPAVAVGGRRGSEASSLPAARSQNAYSVTISSSRPPANPRESAGSMGGYGLQTTATGASSSYGAPVPARASINPNVAARRRNHEVNNAAWSYTKCALLFFTAILITWIPSSANRVYSVIHNGETSSPLEYMSAFVLPLQGFWNAIIYVVTSWKACKSLVSDIRLGRRPPVKDLVGGFGSRDRLEGGVGAGRKLSAKTYESESMTELSSSRPPSNEQRRRY